MKLKDKIVDKIERTLKLRMEDGASVVVAYIVSIVAVAVVAGVVSLF